MRRLPASARLQSRVRAGEDVSEDVERLARLARGFARLIEMLRAGVAPSPPVARPPRVGGSSPRAGRLYPVRMDETGLPGGGEVFANGVKLLLADDAIAELVATDPRAQRLLQSACAVFGVRMHQFLRPRPPSREYETPASVSFVVPDDPVELQRLKNQKAAQDAAAQNRRTAPGTATGLGGKEKTDPFVAGFLDGFRD